MTTTTEAQLELVGIVKRFGGASAAAVDGVSLSVTAGELFALIGPSGCGKTTLLRVVAGLERPDEGRVLVDGTDVSGRAPEKRGMAMVFQSYALFPHLNALDNVAFGLSYAGVPRARRASVAAGHLERVGLADLAQRMPAELSGGQQQRVALARALAVSPRILLLDEPLSNLDARLRESTRADIKALLAAEGVTALYVTHDQEEAMALADRVAVMRDGRLEQVGAPEQVYRHPRTAFVAQFVARASLLEGKVVAVEGELLEVDCGGLRLRGSPPREQSLEVGAAVRAAVRGECLRLGAEAMDPLAGRARVVDRSFLGAMVSITLELDAGERLTALAAASSSLPTPGDIVPCAVDAGAVTLFADA